MWEFNDMRSGDYLAHYGVKGMHWGIRRAGGQNGTGYDRRLRRNIRRTNRQVGKDYKNYARNIARTFDEMGEGDRLANRKIRIAEKRANAKSKGQINRLNKKYAKTDAKLNKRIAAAEKYAGISDKYLDSANSRLDNAKRDSRVTSYNTRKRANTLSAYSRGGGIDVMNVQYDREKLVANNKRGSKKAQRRHRSKAGTSVGRTTHYFVPY